MGWGDDYQVRSLGIDAETTTQILACIKTRDEVADFQPTLGDRTF
jgi:hypothetical protein